MKHFAVTFKPDNITVSAHAGATLVEAAGMAGIILNTSCGGKGICKKCALTIEPAGRSVLACQYHIQTDLTVTVPLQSRYFQQKILEYGIDRQIKVHPTVCKKHLNITSTAPEDLLAALNQNHPGQSFKLSPGFLHQAQQSPPQTLDRGITAVCHLDPACTGRAADRQSAPVTYNAVALEPGDTTDKIYGVALDIGTTTVVARLINMITGQCLATQADTNPQIHYGDDVISRIAYAQSDKKLAQLQKSIIRSVNHLITSLCRRTGIDSGNIYELCAVGNTTMNHIFLRLPVVSLGYAPYKSYSLDAHDRPAEMLNLRLHPAANVHTVENIAGFVGADTTAVALAVNIDAARETTLVVDIGTNGEILLATHNKLYAASCAAGPALEGARISHGSRAANGAIEAVLRNGDDIEIDVIGNAPPTSICGSGLIDAVATLLDFGILDATGRFADPQKPPPELPNPLRSRLVEHNGQPAFILAENKDQPVPAVMITQKDIREVQLAKAAIRAGIKLLQKKTDLADADIKHVLLAGAFGTYIRKASALRIGLLPDVGPERIIFVGNAAVSGARMILVSRRARALAAGLARKIEYVEIAHQPDFAAVYTDCMIF